MNTKINQSLTLAYDVDLIKAGFYSWRHNPPANNTWVWAKYSINDDFFMAKTCKTGCCVYSNGDNLMIPEFWKEATEEERRNKKRRRKM